MTDSHVSACVNLLLCKENKHRFSDASLEKETKPKRPISTNLNRRPLGGKQLSMSDKPLLEQSLTLPKTRAREEPEPEVDKYRRLSVDSEGITTPKAARKMAAAMKLREKFVEESDDDDDSYEEIVTKAEIVPKPR